MQGRGLQQGDWQWGFRKDGKMIAVDFIQRMTADIAISANVTVDFDISKGKFQGNLLTGYRALIFDYVPAESGK